MPFKPGQSGNPHRRRAESQFRNELTFALGAGDDKHARLCRFAKRLVRRAEKGVPWAIKMVAKRLDGRSHQAVNVGADDGAGLMVEVVSYAEADAVGRLMQRIDGKSCGLPNSDNNVPESLTASRQ